MDVIIDLSQKFIVSLSVATRWQSITLDGDMTRRPPLRQCLVIHVDKNANTTGSTTHYSHPTSRCECSLFAWFECCRRDETSGVWASQCLPIITECHPSECTISRNERSTKLIKLAPFPFTTKLFTTWTDWLFNDLLCCSYLDWLVILVSSFWHDERKQTESVLSSIQVTSMWYLCHQ